MSGLAMTVASVLLVVGLVALAIVAGIAVSVFAWCAYRQWAARSYVRAQRRQAKAAVKRERETAAQREEALLKGAVTVANQLVQTVVVAQLQQLMLSEREHHEQMSELVQRLMSNPATVVGPIDVAPIGRAKAAGRQAIGSPSGANQRCPGLLARVRRRLLRPEESNTQQTILGD
jgi:FlaA1/EpsC-like NDP-sugar epimerase